MATEKQRLKAAGVSQAELAAALGVSRSAISQHLSGARTLSANKAAELERMLRDREAGAASGVPCRHVTVRQAARCMGVSDQFVRVGLQQGRLPIGTAVPGTGSKWIYYISAERLREYAGARAYDRYFGEEDDT